MFMPEGGTQVEPGVTAATPASPETTSEDIALMQRVFAAAIRNPNLIPSDFMSYLVDFIQTQRLDVPIGQVFGYQQQTDASITAAVKNIFTAHIAHAEAQVDITSNSYATFSGAPSISGLDNGSYVVWWGASANGDIASGGSSLNLTFRSNGATTGDVCEQGSQNVYSSIARADTTVALSAGAGANTLDLVALTTAAGKTSRMRDVYLACLKYSN